MYDVEENHMVQDQCWPEYHHYLEENERELEEEELDELEEELDENEEELDESEEHHFWDEWPDERKKKFAAQALKTYEELETKYHFHYTEEQKNRWRAYLE